MINGTNRTDNSEVDQGTYMFASHERSIHHILVHTNQDIKGDKAKIIET